MKYNKSMLLSLLVSNYDVAFLIVSSTDTDPTSFFFILFYIFFLFIYFFNFSVSEQSYQVSVCIFLIIM